MAKEKEQKTFLLRLPKKAFEAVKKAAGTNKRSINSEIELTLEQKYL
jgi:hypothetical protein